MSRLLKSIFRTASILFLLASFAGCASNPKILADYDPGNDFGAYNTWDFIKDAGPDYDGYESLFSQYMMEAIAIEMDKRGYTRSTTPDIFLNFNALVQDKTKVTQTQSMGYPMGAGGYYGYRASKTAVNQIGTNLKHELKPRGIAVALLHPGLVATEMTGGQGVSPAESARGLIERIDALNLENSGGFWHAEGYTLPW